MLAQCKSLSVQYCSAQFNLACRVLAGSHYFFILVYVVALIAAGGIPARYRGVWPVSDIDEDTFGYCVHSTLSTVVWPLCNDSARALSF